MWKEEQPLLPPPPRAAHTQVRGANGRWCLFCVDWFVWLAGLLTPPPSLPPSLALGIGSRGTGRPMWRDEAVMVMVVMMELMIMVMMRMNGKRS